MKPFVLLLTALFLSLCLLCGCGAQEIKPDPINEGETYLEGCWYLNDGDLHVGYNLFPDGGGFLFIGETVIPIRYGISGGYFYVSDNGNVESFPFRTGENGIWIGDMLYQPMEDDPEISAAVESMRAEMDLSEKDAPSSGSSGQIGALLVQLITLAAAVGIVVILAMFFRKRRKKSN
ncbi:MAG: hypothetical protein J1E00_08545 [Oscillospiraceae bacterium]|nr:hypothetical protein [Oscillospiraceae bacterium]